MLRLIPPQKWWPAPRRVRGWDRSDYRQISSETRSDRGRDGNSYSGPRRVLSRRSGRQLPAVLLAERVGIGGRFLIVGADLCMITTDLLYRADHSVRSPGRVHDGSRTEGVMHKCGFRPRERLSRQSRSRSPRDGREPRSRQAPGSGSPIRPPSGYRPPCRFNLKSGYPDVSSAW
jgi:hypothetical protein